MSDVAQPAREPGEEHPCLKQSDELHELGFNAGWNGAIEEASKVAERNGWERTAETIRALSQPSPAAEPPRDLGLCDRVKCACACREALAKEVERLTRARSAPAATVDDCRHEDYCLHPSCECSAPPSSSAATEDVKSKQAWQELVNKDDRTSPEEYPDHCLITFEELEDFMSRSRDISAGSVVPSLQGLVSDDDWNRALGCAYSCLEAPSISLADFDNAMQHAFGMLSLRRLSLNEPQEASEPVLSHADLCALSRIYNDRECPVPHGTNFRINEWLKVQIASALTRPHHSGETK